MSNAFQYDKEKIAREFSVFFVDAFVTGPGSGNPAGVCILKNPISQIDMQAVARENAVPVTAFLLIREDKTIQIRWFTPVEEIPLCGHATLASAHVLFSEFGHGPDAITFSSRHHGDLTVRKKGAFIELNFPALSAREIPVSDQHRALFSSVYLAFKADRLILLLRDEEELKNYVPDFDQIRQLDEYAVGASALSNHPDYDICSRYFAPHLGVDEDPVCGSLHCYLTPIWTKHLNKVELHAYHASPRGGAIKLKLETDSVQLSGQALTKFHMVK